MKGTIIFGGYHDQIPLQLTITRWWFPFSKGLVQPPTRLADSQVAL